MKPNNILLDSDGHVRLADLGGVIDQEGQTLGKKSEFLHPLFSIKYNEVLDEGDKTSLTKGKKKLKRRMSVMGTFGYMGEWSAVLMCNLIHCITLHYNTIQYNTIQYNTIQYNTIQYNYLFSNSFDVCSVYA